MEKVAPTIFLPSSDEYRPWIDCRLFCPDLWGHLSVLLLTFWYPLLVWPWLPPRLFCVLLPWDAPLTLFASVPRQVALVFSLEQLLELLRTWLAVVLLTFSKNIKFGHKKFSNSIKIKIDQFWVFSSRQQCKILKRRTLLCCWGQSFFVYIW